MDFSNLYLMKFLQSKYFILLLALLTMLLGFPLMENLTGGKLLFSIFLLFILVGMFYGLKGRKGSFVFLATGIIALAINLAEMGFKQLHLVSQAISVFFFLYAIVLFSKDIFSKDEISQDILLGSISVYLLIGICFGLIFMLMQSINGNAIVLAANQLPISATADFYYFSFITLATVGFGDILANTPFAKSLVMLEGVVGIFYLAILVARLINSNK